MRAKKMGSESRRRFFYLPVFLAGVFLLSVGFGLSEDFYQGKTVWLALSAFILLGGLAVCLAVAGKLTPKAVILLLFAAGVLLRLCYILYTGYTDRQHDMRSFYKDYTGHAGYIRYIFDKGSLPDFHPREAWQFYHPPLHHVLAAVWMKLQMLCGVSLDYAVEGIQFLTLFYSSCCMLISYRIFRELKLEGGGLLCAFALVAFNPSFIIFSGSINNDILATTFSCGALLVGIRWAKSKSWIHIMQLAFLIGLGMLAKTSAAIVAPCMAVVFAWVFFKKGSDKKRLFLQYLSFAAVCIPLGLFWAARNLVLFGDPCLAVPMLSLNTEQYIGTYSLVERFLIPIKETFRSEFVLWGPVYENHALAALLKTSAFGEFILTDTAPIVGYFTPFLLFFNCAVAFLGLYGGIRTVLDKEMGGYAKVLTCGNYLLSLVFYFYFCYSFPHTCSMNIRYVALLLVLTALFVGRLVGPKSPKWLSRTAVGLTGFFCLFSAVVYTLLGVG